MKFRDRFNSKFRFNLHAFGTQSLDLVTNILKYKKTGSVLDLGCGNGRNALFLLSKGFHVTGVDLSKVGLDLIRKKAGNYQGNIKLILSDVTKLETDEKFDLVLAIGLLHFLQINQIKQLLLKIKLWTKPEGLNVIAVRMSQNYKKDLPYVFKPGELIKIYQNPEWKVLESREDGRVAKLIAKKIR